MHPQRRVPAWGRALTLAAVAFAATAACAGDCSVSQRAPAKYCAACDRAFDPEKEKDRLDRDGNCARCREKVRDIELCVRTFRHCARCAKDFADRAQ